VISFREFTAGSRDAIDFRKNANFFVANDLDRSGALDLSELAAYSLRTEDVIATTGLSPYEVAQNVADTLSNPLTWGPAMQQLRQDLTIAHAELTNTLPPGAFDVPRTAVPFGRFSPGQVPGGLPFQGDFWG
jgi:hypothetical protein